MRSRLKWEPQKVKEFTDWHERRMKELQYPEAVVNELRRSRNRWIPAAKENHEAKR